MESGLMKTIATIIGLIAVVLTVAMKWNDSLIFAAGGFWALLLVLVPPALAKQPKLFSIWSFVILTVGIGLTARGIFISFNLSDPEEIDRLYLLGQEPEFFIKPLAMLLVGLGMLTGGYLSVLPKENEKNHREWDSKKVVRMGVIVLIIAVGSAALYAFFTDGLNPDLISKKRTPIPGLDLTGKNFQSYGILRHLSLLAIFAHLIVLAQAFQSRKRSHFILAFALLAAACLQPFYASVRTVVAANFIFSAAAVYYFGGKNVSIKLAGFFVIIALLVTLMTALRPGGSERNIIESIVLNRNQIELPKTAHIINAIPDKLDFQYGKTLTRWLAAPIPREFWPDKPIIPPGPIIGNRIYGQRVAGVPPSFVAELWWNFGWFGIVLGSFGFGTGVRWVENRFLPLPEKNRGRINPTAVVVFIAGPMLLGYGAVGSSIGSGIFKTVLGLIFIHFLLWFVKRK